MLPFFPKHWLVDRNAWKERAIIWLAAVATGLVVVAFCRVTDFAGGYFNTLTRHYAWITLLLCPLTAVAIVWVTRRFFPGAEGSGIPEVSAALREHTPEEKVGRWVSLRIAFGKVVLCAVGLAAGFSIGREGPSVQFGASVMYAAYGDSHFTSSRIQSACTAAAGMTVSTRRSIFDMKKTPFPRGETRADHIWTNSLFL